MASSKRFTAEQALEQLLESDEEKSGADSFYTDDEVFYQDGEDPFEDWYVTSNNLFIIIIYYIIHLEYVYVLDF